MALALANSQGELSPLERGMHALHSGMEVKAYAAMVGRAGSTVAQEYRAAKVATAVMHVHNDLSDLTRHLAEIHAAPEWLWPALVHRNRLPPSPFIARPGFLPRQPGHLGRCWQTADRPIAAERFDCGDSAAVRP